MRKLLFIALFVLGTTLAWAGGVSQRSDEDWYNQKLGAQVDQFSRINATVAPSQTAFEEQENISGERPGSMANPSLQNEDWYNQKLAVQTELSRRDLAAIKNSAGL